MSVTIAYLEAETSRNEIRLRPGYTNLRQEYKTLDLMCQSLGIERSDIQKVDELATYPMLTASVSHRLNRYCTTVRIRGDYFLLTWEGNEEHLAAHAYRFPRWSTPFTHEAITSPPAPPAKRDSDKTLTEFLWGRWKGKQKQEPFILT